MSWDFANLEIQFTKNFSKGLKQLTLRDQTLVFKKIKLISQGGLLPQVKKLNHSPKGNYRIKISPLRVIFEYIPDHKLVIFTVFKPRRDLY